MAWGVYKNGNSICKINLDDGTKIRETNDDHWDLEFPESLDLNIGNRCDGGCPFCYIIRDGDRKSYYVNEEQLKRFLNGESTK
jgi:2-iminoacetate synthase ThiH